MIPFSYIVTPIAGAFIGYITNDLAIRMLFHPYKAHYLFGHRIPFTPGLIPKEKDRMAATIAQMISEKLMTEDTIRENLLSDDVIGKISSTITDYGKQLQQDQRTLRQTANGLIGEEEVNKIESNAIDSLTAIVSGKLVNANLGDSLATQAIEEFKEQSNFVVQLGISAFEETLHEKIENTIDTLLRTNAKAMTAGMIKGCIGDILTEKLCDVLGDKDDLVATIKDAIIRQYKTTILEQMPKILDTLNIQLMVENKIKAMEVKEMEDLIFGVMNRELKYIVYLGALLGFLMGFVTLALNQLAN